jgi:hypothetical protein
MKVTIKKIFTKEQISPRTNKAYTSMSIKTEEHGDAWLSGFKDRQNENWQEGDVVEIDVVEKDVNGKKFYNYSLPKSPSYNKNVATSAIEAKLKNLEDRVELLEGALTDNN